MWRSSAARWVCPVVGLIMAGVGLVFGRADVVLVGIPLVLLFALGRPPSKPEASVTCAADAESVTATTSADALRLRLTSEGYRQADLLLGGGTHELGVTRESARTGPRPPLVIDWSAHGVLTFSAPQATISRPLVVLPAFTPLVLVPQSRLLRGLTGPATSRRAGDGFEFRDVHPMGPADSLRRIDWKVTARQTDTDSIWVKGTYATGEATAVLIIDSRDEVGSDLHAWHASVPLRVDEPTSLDLARHAAASVARYLIAAGARVGMADLARASRTMTPATGPRHLNRLLYALALSAPLGQIKKRVRAPKLPTGSIIYLFTTLLDDESVNLVRTVRQAGHEVLVVDTLPPVRPVAETNLMIAWRILSAERTARIIALAGQRVPVISWTGAAREQLAAIERGRRRQR